MKKFFAILALTVVEATSKEKYCWDKCLCWMADYDCSHCYSDCME